VGSFACACPIEVDDVEILRPRLSHGVDGAERIVAIDGGLREIAL
jgi:hypothetical protein